MKFLGRGQCRLQVVTESIQQTLTISSEVMWPGASNFVCLRYLITKPQSVD